MTTVWPGAVDSYTTKVDNVTDVLAAHINNPQDAIVALETPLRDMSLMRVKNTSGSTVAANDVGYIDEAGEFKLNTTDFRDGVNWAVVVEGAANNADIIVTNKGLVTVVCNGNVSAGDFLYLSTTTKQVQPQSYMRPEMMAIAKTANTGGAGGTCVVLLHCDRKYVSLASTNKIYQVQNHSDTRFEATINGAPSATSVVYNAPGAGAENVIVPVSPTELAKARLWNTTRGTYRLITAVNQGTNTITTVSSTDSWADTDAITIESQTTTVADAYRYIELDFSQDTVAVPELACVLEFEVLKQDSGGAVFTVFHPFEARAEAKEKGAQNPGANVRAYRTIFMPLIQRVFCYRSNTSGAATGTLDIFKLEGAFVAKP